MAELTLEGGPRAKNLVMSEELTIKDAQTLKDLLLEAKQTVERLLIDTTATQSMDLACAQVLCAAHRSYEQADKTIELIQPISDGILSSLASMGISPACCPVNMQGSCIWKKGD